MSKKAVLISIKPKWVVKILNGEKTIEVRKSKPKCDLPIDVYIYCTKQNAKYYIENKIYNSMINGKVVAKFTLNKVEEIENCVDILTTKTLDCSQVLTQSCLNYEELHNYLDADYGYKGYAWHISNLVIFDKPKDLSEFRKYYRSKGFPQNRSWNLTKAPQSWCYVESEK